MARGRTGSVATHGQRQRTITRDFCRPSGRPVKVARLRPANWSIMRGSMRRYGTVQLRGGRLSERVKNGAPGLARR